MKKLLVFGVMFGLLFSIVGVIADQTVIINGEEVIDFSINDIDFGDVIPGNSAIGTSTLTVNVPNNIDFLIDICLDDSSNSVFELMEFDFTALGGVIDTPITLCSGLTPFEGTVDDTDVIDTSTSQNKDLPVSLDFPVGILPGPRSGTVVYTAMGPAP